MLKLTVLASYVTFILGTGPLAGSLYGGCWPACSGTMGNKVTVDQGSCDDPGDTCCSEPTRLAPLPAKTSAGPLAFHASLNWGTVLDTTPKGDQGHDSSWAAYPLEVWPPPVSHLIPLRI